MLFPFPFYLDKLFQEAASESLLHHFSAFGTPLWDYCDILGLSLLLHLSYHFIIIGTLSLVYWSVIFLEGRNCYIHLYICIPVTQWWSTNIC